MRLEVFESQLAKFKSTFLTLLSIQKMYRVWLAYRFTQKPVLENVSKFLGIQSLDYFLDTFFCYLIEEKNTLIDCCFLYDAQK